MPHWGQTKMSMYFFCHKKVTRPERHSKRANNLLSQGGGKLEVDTTVVDLHVTSGLYLHDWSISSLLVENGFLLLRAATVFCGSIDEPSVFHTQVHKSGPTGESKTSKISKRCQCAVVQTTVPSVFYFVVSTKMAGHQLSRHSVVTCEPAAAAADFCNSAPLVDWSRWKRAALCLRVRASVLVAARSIQPWASVCVSLCTIHLPDCNQGHVILRAVYFSCAAFAWPPREAGPLQRHVHFYLDSKFSQYISR